MRLRFAVLASVLSGLMAVAVPGIVNAAPKNQPKHNHSLTINATPNPVQAGDGVLIYGQITGNPVGGQKIRLYQRVNQDRRFTLAGTVKTNSFGFYEFPPEKGVVYSNRTWFVRGPDGSHSRRIHERVYALVSLKASTTTAYTNRPVVFSGHVTPNHRFERVYLQQKSAASDDWHTIKTGVLNADSNYSIAYRFRIPTDAPGERDLRVVLRGDVRNIRSESDPISITIQQAQRLGFTIHSSSPIIDEGGSATISGVLDKVNPTSAAAPTPEPNTGVTLWGRTFDQPHFRAIASTTTGTDGSYKFTVQPTQNELYQVRTTLKPHRASTVLFEGVRDVVTLAADSTSTTAGRVVKLTGSVTPDKAGHVIYLQRLGADGDWHRLNATLVRHDSTFQFVERFGGARSQTLRARIASDEHNVGGVSKPVTITVTLPPVSSLPPTS